MCVVVFFCSKERTSGNMLEFLAYFNYARRVVSTSLYMLGRSKTICNHIQCMHSHHGFTTSLYHILLWFCAFSNNIIQKVESPQTQLRESTLASSISDTIGRKVELQLLFVNSPVVYSRVKGLESAKAIETEIVLYPRRQKNVVNRASLQSGNNKLLRILVPDGNLHADTVTYASLVKLLNAPRQETVYDRASV